MTAPRLPHCPQKPRGQRPFPPAGTGQTPTGRRMQFSQTLVPGRAPRVAEIWHRTRQVFVTPSWVAVFRDQREKGRGMRGRAMCGDGDKSRGHTRCGQSPQRETRGRTFCESFVVPRNAAGRAARLWAQTRGTPGTFLPLSAESGREDGPELDESLLGGSVCGSFYRQKAVPTSNLMTQDG